MFNGDKTTSLLPQRNVSYRSLLGRLKSCLGPRRIDCLGRSPWADRPSRTFPVLSFSHAHDVLFSERIATFSHHDTPTYAPFALQYLQVATGISQNTQCSFLELSAPQWLRRHDTKPQDWQRHPRHFPGLHGQTCYCKCKGVYGLGHRFGRRGETQRLG